MKTLPAMLIFLAMSAMAGCSTETQQTSPGPLEPGAYKIGRSYDYPGRYASWSIALHDAVVPGNGTIRINADLSLIDAHFGSETWSSIKWYDNRKKTYLQDDLGRTYKLADTGGVFRTETRLAVSQTVSGWLVFEVPHDDISELILYNRWLPPSTFTFRQRPRKSAVPTDIPPPTPLAAPLPGGPGEPSIYLYGTQTHVELGQPVLLDLSVVNSIGKPDMTAQFIVRVPTGWSLSGAGFSQACTGQCSAVYEVSPGGNRSIQVTLQPNQFGSNIVQGRLEWFFGGDKSTLKGENLSILVIVDSPTTPTPTPTKTRVQRPNGSDGCSAPSTSGARVGASWLLFGMLWPWLALLRRRAS